MKKIFLLGTVALFCTTLFSCTADEYETPAKNQVKKIVNPVADGPGDDPVPPPPPPPKD